MARTKKFRQLLAPLPAALQMLKGRPLRSGLMVFQFTVGFSALIILAVLIAQSQALTSTLERTFTTSRVLGLYPEGGSVPTRPARPPLTPEDLPALESLPGVRRAAVLWQTSANLPGNDSIPLFAVNSALEELIHLDVEERFAPDAPTRVSEAGESWVFLTPASQRRFTRPDGSLPTSFTFRVAGKEITARVAGVVSPPVSWPGSTGSLGDLIMDPPALVIDLAGVREQAWLTNALWLILQEGADPDVVRQSVQDWFHTAYPDWDGSLDGLFVADEIARRAAIRQPGTWVAAVLATLFVLLAGLGFTGHAMLMADIRRSEWALRLAIGVTRFQLMLQVLTEVALTILTAAILSTMIVAPIVPILTESTGYAVPFDWLSTSLGVTAIATFVLSALAAAYPIIRIRREEPSAILKEGW